jgi:hypothetical protein
MVMAYQTDKTMIISRYVMDPVISIDMEKAIINGV